MATFSRYTVPFPESTTIAERISLTLTLFEETVKECEGQVACTEKEKQPETQKQSTSALLSACRVNDALERFNLWVEQFEEKHLDQGDKGQGVGPHITPTRSERICDLLENLAEAIEDLRQFTSLNEYSDIEANPEVAQKHPFVDSRSILTASTHDDEHAAREVWWQLELIFELIKSLYREHLEVLTAGSDNEGTERDNTLLSGPGGSMSLRPSEKSNLSIPAALDIDAPFVSSVLNLTAPMDPALTAVRLLDDGEYSRKCEAMTTQQLQRMRERSLRVIYNSSKEAGVSALLIPTIGLSSISFALAFRKLKIAHRKLKIIDEHLQHREDAPTRSLANRLLLG